MAGKPGVFRYSVRFLRFAVPHAWLAALAIVGMGAFAATNACYLALVKPVISTLTEHASRESAGRGVELPEPPPSAQEPLSGRKLQRRLKDRLKAVPGAETLRTFVRERTDSLAELGLLAACLAPLLFVSNYVQEYFRARLLWSVVVDIRNQMCDRLLPQSLSYFEDRRSGDIISRLTNDIGMAQNALTFLYGDLVLQPMMLICGLAMAVYFSWELALCAVIGIPATVIPIRIYGKRVRTHGRESLERLADLTDEMNQMFQGIRVVKAFKMEAEERSEFGAINARHFRQVMKAARARTLSSSTTELIFGVGVALLLVAGGYIITLGRITTGDLGGFMAAAWFAVRPVKRLTKCYTVLQESSAGAERIFELLDHEVQIKDDPNAVELAEIRQGVSFKAVSFAYNAEPVLRDITLEVRKGEVAAIVGESGAGKTTLLDLIPRFYDPQSGRVEVDGMDLRRIKRASLLDHIAVVTQQTFLFNRSIADNIRSGRKNATFEEVQEAAKVARIHDFIVSLPQGYDTVVGELGVKLSGGQRQRIAIARAVLKNPAILILDEATSALDSESERQVQEALNNLMQGRTTFVIAHRLSTVHHADKIVVLKAGRIVETGTHEQLLAAQGEYYRLYQTQFGAFGGNSQAP